MARKGRRQSLKGGAEYDVVSGYARSIYCYLVNNRGVKAKIKKKMNKRARQEGKLEIQETD